MGCELSMSMDALAGKLLCLMLIKKSSYHFQTQQLIFQTHLCLKNTKYWDRQVQANSDNPGFSLFPISFAVL